MRRSCRRSVRGTPAAIEFAPDVAFFRVNPALAAEHRAKPREVATLSAAQAPAGKTREGEQLWQRAPGSRDVFVEGNVLAGQAAVHEELAIPEPALYAAMALKAALERHGVVVHGGAVAEHHANSDVRSFVAESHERATETECWDCLSGGKPAPENQSNILAEHQSVPLVQDIVLTMKVSQNLHAEMMLRNLAGPHGSLVRGEQKLRAYWMQAGVDPDDFAFFDGSGLSTKDVVTPRAIARMLAYSATQPWFPAWKAALPVGGQDGSLASRFDDKSGLTGRVFAKTGTLGETRALSGYVIAKSGQTLIFSVIVDTHLPGTSADREAMDRIVAAIAEAN